MALHMMQAEDGAGRAHQRARDDQHRVVEREADARAAQPGVVVEHADHHRHVGPADGDDQRHAEHEAEQHDEPEPSLWQQ